jgi:DNA gyrase subunit A
VYKYKTYDIPDTKVAAIGEYLPGILGLEDGERIIYTVVTKDYSGNMLFTFENGKMAKVELKNYETKTNRKKLTNAYSADSKAVGIFYVPEAKTRADHKDFLIVSDGGKAMIVSSNLLTKKVTRTSSGATCFTLKKGQKITSATFFVDDGSEKMREMSRYRKTKIPSTGTTVTNVKQLTFL